MSNAFKLTIKRPENIYNALLIENVRQMILNTHIQKEAMISLAIALRTLTCKLPFSLQITFIHIVIIDAP